MSARIAVVFFSAIDHVRQLAVAAGGDDGEVPAPFLAATHRQGARLAHFAALLTPAG